jgi:hypothetical protein
MATRINCGLLNGEKNGTVVLMTKNHKKVPAEAGTDTPNYREDPDSHKSGRQG